MEVLGTTDLDISKKLIKLIKEQPFLYDKTLEEFKDEARKSEAWNELALSLNMSGKASSHNDHIFIHTFVGSSIYTFSFYS